MMKLYHALVIEYTTVVSILNFSTHFSVSDAVEKIHSLMAQHKQRYPTDILDPELLWISDPHDEDYTWSGYVLESSVDVRTFRTEGFVSHCLDAGDGIVMSPEYIAETLKLEADSGKEKHEQQLLGGEAGIVRRHCRLP